MTTNKNNFIYDDPDLIKAAKELDDEFPGAIFDASLHKYLRREALIKKIFKKIIFHSVFYTLCVIIIAAFFFRKPDSNIWNSLVFGLLWFIGYALYADSTKQMEKNNEQQ